LYHSGLKTLRSAAGGQIAIGGAITTQGQTFLSEFVFSSTGSGDPQDGDTALFIQTLGCPEPPSGPIVIIPTMGQWGMVIASVILGFFAIIRLRRIKDSELE